MEMTNKKANKVEAIKGFLKENGIFFDDSFPNGQLQVDGVNFWATSEKWYNPATGEKGKGINAFIKHLKENNII